MPIPVTCPTCNSKLSAPDNAAGRQAKCPKCGNAVPIPRPAEQAASTQPVPAEASAPPAEGNANLRPCPDCGRQVSRRATQCPHCGCPLITAGPAAPTAMPGLVPCKACRTPVAESAPACPKCGVTRPGAKTGKLAITRAASATGGVYAVQVFVDGQLAGEVKNGATLTLDLPAGQRRVEVRGGGMSRSAAVTIQDGKTVKYEMYFSSLGIFGGGLNFKPA